MKSHQASFFLKHAVAATLAVASGLLTASTARADDAAPAKSPESDVEQGHDEADERFERGLALFDERDYVSSLAEFRRAYVLKPVYKLRYNIGGVCLELRDYACALKELQAYLAEGGDQISTQRRESVGKNIARASSRVAHLEIVTTEGAQLEVDDQPAGTAPLREDVIVNAGRHKITASRSGWTTETTWVEATGTDSVRVSIALHPLRVEGQATSTPAPERPVSTPSRWTTASFLGLGAGGLLLTGAAIAGISAGVERDDLKEQRFAGPIAPDAMRASADRANTLAITADVLGAAGLVTLGITLGMTLFRSPPTTKAGLGVSPGGFHGTF
jgi:hypothetical protein